MTQRSLPRTALLSIAVIIIGMIGYTTAQLDTIAPKIPDHLLMCYKNNSLYHRENRLPATLDVFLDILRKIENSPAGKSKDARNIAMNLLFLIRMDGISGAPPSSDDSTSTSVVPFAPKGFEYFRHRVMLLGLLPNRQNDPNFLKELNETLTLQEICSLHFMISSSFDIYERGDEGNVCSNTAELFKTGSRTTVRRSKRDTNEGDKQVLEEKPRKHKKVKAFAGKKNFKKQKIDWDSESRIAKREILTRAGADAEYTLNSLRNVPASKTKHEVRESLKKFIQETNSRIKRETADDAEVIAPAILDKLNKQGKEPEVTGEKGDFTIGGSQYLNPVKNPRTSTVSKSVIPNKSLTGAASSNPRISNVPESKSNCPVENGVISTGYGSVTIGTVIAGICAGLNRVKVRLSDLIPSHQDGTADTPQNVDNLFAVTLAGDLAETILAKTQYAYSQEFPDSVGLKGGWNDTFNPKWYFISSNNYDYFTDAEIRGALDGLWLGSSMEELSRISQSFKLSQVLSMFYSDIGLANNNTIKAGSRKDQSISYAPKQTVTEQTSLMFQVLDDQSTHSVTYTPSAYTEYPTKIVEKLQSYIPTLPDPDYSTKTTIYDKHVYKAVNLVWVVDTAWPFEIVTREFNILKEGKVAADLFHSNLTIITGQGRLLLENASSSIDVTRGIQKSVYEQEPKGFEINIVLDALLNYFKNQFDVEKVNRMSSTYSNIALLNPYQSSDSYDSKALKERKIKLNSTHPDVTFLLLAQSRDKYLELLNVEADDYFTVPDFSNPLQPKIDPLQNLIDRITKAHQRITSPYCSRTFVEVTQPTTITNFISPNFVRTYKVHPNYFFDSGDNAVITITSESGYGNIKVCHSRNNPYPLNIQENTTAYSNLSPRSRLTSTSEDAVCSGDLSSGSYKIMLSNPCSGVSTISECKPLYITVYAPPLSRATFRCAAGDRCESIADIMYKIKIDGFTCKSGVAKILINPFTLILIIISFGFY